MRFRLTVASSHVQSVSSLGFVLLVLVFWARTFCRCVIDLLSFSEPISQRLNPANDRPAVLHARICWLVAIELYLLYIERCVSESMRRLNNAVAVMVLSTDPASTKTRKPESTASLRVDYPFQSDTA